MEARSPSVRRASIHLTSASGGCDLELDVHIDMGARRAAKGDPCLAALPERARAVDRISPFSHPQLLCPGCSSAGVVRSSDGAMPTFLPKPSSATNVRHL